MHLRHKYSLIPLSFRTFGIHTVLIQWKTFQNPPNYLYTCAWGFVSTEISAHTHTCDFSNKSTRTGGSSSASRYSSSSPSSYGRRIVSESSNSIKHKCYTRNDCGTRNRKITLGLTESTSSLFY